MKAEFDGTQVIAPSEALPLYEQSGYGRPDKSSGSLRLDPKEALYLMARGKIEIPGLSFDTLLTECAKTPGFLRNFVVYRDLRERGYVVTTGPQDFRVFPRGLRPGKGQSRYLMRVLSERDLVDFAAIIKDATTSANMRKQFILAVLDDEHELTYYEIRIGSPTAAKPMEIPYDIHAKIAGIPSYVTEDGDNITEKLKNVWLGTMLDGTRLFLSPLETAWLMETGHLETEPVMTVDEYVKLAASADSEFMDKLTLYRHLKNLGFSPRSGYKYGHHFRVYTESGKHSEMLAHVVPVGTLMSMSAISRSVRLAHSVKKKMFYASISETEITEVEFARMKM